jgi:hypothetical protein
MTFTVTNCPTPAPAVDITDASICLGEDITTFTASGTGFVTWYDDAMIPISTNAAFTPTIAEGTSGSFTYYASLTDGCEGPRTEVSLTINELPTVSLTVDNILCKNSGIITPTLSPAGGTFTIDDVVHTDINTNNLSAGNHQLIYTYTESSTGCSFADTLAIEIRYIAPPSVSNKTTILDNPDLTISASGSGGTLTWVDEDGFTVSTGETITHSGTVQVGSWDYCVSETDGTCTSEEACMTFSIINCPTPAPSVDITDASICLGDAIPTFTASGTGTGLVTWYDDAMNPISTNAAFTPSIADGTSGSFTYYASLTDGCEGPTTKVSLTINELPTVSITVDNILCKNSGIITPTLSPVGGTFTIDDVVHTDINTDNLSAGNHQLIYSYTESSTGCSFADTLDIEIRNIEPPLVSDKTILLTETDYDITASGSGGTLSWTDFNGGSAGTGATISHNGPYEVGSWEYCVSETDGICTSEEACMIFSIIDCPLPAPTVPIALTQACENEPMPTLSVNGTETIRWYDDDDLSNHIFEGNDYQPPALTLGTHHYYVAQFDGSCEGAREKISVEVTKTSVPTITGDTEICEHNTTTLTAQVTSGTVYWYSSNPTSNAPAHTGNSYTTNQLVAGTHSIWTTHQDGCTSDTLETSITVKPQPSPPSTSGDDICEGNDISLSATGTEITWYDNAMNPIGSASTINLSGYAAGTQSFFATQTVDECTSQQTEHSVQVNSIPDEPEVASVSICENENIIALTAENTLGEVNWYSDENLSSPLAQNTITYTPDNKTSHDVYVTQTQNNCTSNPTKASFTVNEIPEMVTFQPANDITMCENKSDPNAKITISTQEEGYIRWYDSETSETPSIDDNRYLTQSLSAAGTFTHFATQTINGCESERNSKTIEILEGPQEPIIVTNNQTICKNDDPKTLQVTTHNNNETISWTNENGDHIGNGTSLTVPKEETPVGGSYTFFAHARVQGCLSIATTALNYSVTEANVPEIKDSIFCFDENSTPTLEVIKGANISWYDENMNPLSECASQNTCSPYITEPGEYIYHISQTIDECESDKRKVTIIASPIPSPVIFGAEEVCEYSTYTYTIQNNNASSIYTWNITGDQMVYEIPEADAGKAGYSKTVDWTSTGIDTIRLTEQNQYGCKDSVEKIVYIAPTPQASFITQNDEQEGLIQFINTTKPHIIAENDIEREIPVDYYWNFGIPHSKNDTIYNDSIFTVSYKYGYYDISLEAIDDFGCRSRITDEIFVKITYGLYIPNAISPTNPARGVRMLKPIGYNLESFKMWVFDKWGNIIWYTEGVDENGSPIGEWDGTIDGKPLPEGSYIYKVEAINADGSQWGTSKNIIGRKNTFGTINIIR